MYPFLRRRRQDNDNRGTWVVVGKHCAGEAQGTESLLNTDAAILAELEIRDGKEKKTINTKDLC